MKKLLAFSLVALLGLVLAACTNNAQTEEQPAADVLNLEGTWIQGNANDGETYLEAVIEGESITINWVFADGNSLFWAGSYIVPTSIEDRYSWISEANTEAMSSAILGAKSGSLEFKYDEGILTFDVSVMGSYNTIAMQRLEE